MALLEQLSHISLDNISAHLARVTARENENDVTRDVIRLSATSTGVREFLARRVANKSDPESFLESSCRKLCEHVDDDKMHIHQGLGIWKTKKGVTRVHLADACKSNGLKTSGPRDRLLARLRHAWKHRGLSRDPWFAGGGRGLSEGRVLSARKDFAHQRCIRGKEMPPEEDVYALKNN